jgi:hypothetical protein
MHVRWTGALQRDLPPKSGVRLSVGLVAGGRLPRRALQHGRGSACGIPLAHPVKSHRLDGRVQHIEA